MMQLSNTSGLKRSPRLGRPSPALRALVPGCRALQGPSPQKSVPIGSTRLQLPSKSALFYIEGGFYTSGPVGLSTMPRTQPNRARSRILCPSGALATPPEP